MKHAHIFDLTVSAVAEHYALQPRTIRARLKSGDIDGVRIGGHWRLSWDDVLATEQGPAPSSVHLARYKEPLLSKKALASQWGTSISTVDRWINAGLPTRNVFGSVRIAPRDADIWLAKQFNVPKRRRKRRRKRQKSRSADRQPPHSGPVAS